MDWKSLRFHLKIYMVAAAGLVLLAGCAEKEEPGPEESSVQEEETEEETTVSGSDSVMSAEEYFNSLLAQDSNIYDKNPVQKPEENPMPPVVPDKNPPEEPEKTDAIEIDTLDADSDYLEFVPMGASCLVDLNSDGKKDLVRYNAVSSEIAEYGTTVDTLEINGGQYRYTLYLSNQGIHIQNPDLTEYYITDIDTRDRYREIAILDHGANGIPYTYFIRYTGSGTYCLGYVPYFPDDDCFLIKGDGSVQSAYDLKLLKNRQVPALWLSGSDQTVGSNLTMYQPDVFYLEEEEENRKLLKDLKVYAGRDLKSDGIVLKASDAAVSFLKTDDRHWVYIRQDGGSEGWMYMENSETVVNGDKKYNRRDIFSGL